MSSKHKDVGRLDQKKSVNKLFENLPYQGRIHNFLREGARKFNFSSAFTDRVELKQRDERKQL